MSPLKTGRVFVTHQTVIMERLANVKDAIQPLLIITYIIMNAYQKMTIFVKPNRVQIIFGTKEPNPAQSKTTHIVKKNLVMGLNGMVMNVLQIVVDMAKQKQLHYLMAHALVMKTNIILEHRVHV